MPNLIVTKSLKQPKHEKATKAKIHDFLFKLSDDDSTVGLHIEKINNSADPRARTGRVDQSLRAVLYVLEPIGGEKTYVYAGTWEHDTAIERARTRALQINPVTGVAEVLEALPVASEGELESAGTTSATGGVAPASFLEERQYLLSDLTEEFGFSEQLATRAFSMRDEAQLTDLAATLETAWQSDVLIGMAAGLSTWAIKVELGLVEDEQAPDAADERPAPESAPSIDDVADSDEDTRLVRAMQHPMAQMQFTFVEGQDELERIIDADDFGAWRVFLHPEQRRYVERNYNGPFRLTGGAGTGKTVVLLHRARRLARANPEARVVLSTFTKALAGNLRRDLERLDPEVRLADALGDPGIFIAGPDQIAAQVRKRAGSAFAEAAERVLGDRRDGAAPTGELDGWEDVVEDHAARLPPAAAHAAFLDSEYQQVVLPKRLSAREDYFSARRPGRGVALNRAQRAVVWEAIEAYRRDRRLSNKISFAEMAAVATDWLLMDGPLADHVLIDEGQDLSPAHWVLMRALAGEGPNDLFIAEDAHQRIYGRHVVLSRFGIQIRGRSRRLTLNYRTTEENLEYALHLLEGGEYLDSDNKPTGGVGYRSARRGPVPRVIATEKVREQQEAVRDAIVTWTEAGVDPSTIAVLARTKNEARSLISWMSGDGHDILFLARADEPLKDAPAAMTIHTSKGLEFSRVVLFNVSRDAFPPQWLLAKQPQEDREEFLRNERSLLYVGASRARDELVVTYCGEPSELLLGT